MLSRVVSFFGRSFGPQTVPLRIALGVAALSMTISCIFCFLIAVGGGSNQLSQFYIVRFEYAEGAATAARLLRRAETNSNSTDLEEVESVKPSPEPQNIHDKFRANVQELVKNDNGTSGSRLVRARVGYHGICIETINRIGGDNMTCHNVEDARAESEVIGGDPFDLVGIAAYFKDEVAFVLSWYVAGICLGISTLYQILMFLPDRLNSFAADYQKWLLVVSVVGTLACLGSLILQDTAARTVVTIAHSLTVETVDAHFGRMNQGVGWASFGLSLLSNIIFGANVIFTRTVDNITSIGDRLGDRIGDKIGSKLPFSKSEQDVESGPTNPGWSQRTMRLAQALNQK